MAVEGDGRARADTERYGADRTGSGAGNRKACALSPPPPSWLDSGERRRKPPCPSRRTPFPAADRNAAPQDVQSVAEPHAHPGGGERGGGQEQSESAAGTAARGWGASAARNARCAASPPLRFTVTLRNAPRRSAAWIGSALGSVQHPPVSAGADPLSLGPHRDRASGSAVSPPQWILSAEIPQICWCS